MLGWRTPWTQVVCGFFGLLTSLKSICVRRKDSHSQKQPGIPQARTKSGPTHREEPKSKASHSPMHAIAWVGKQRWLTCLWDLVLLLQLCLQEALILGCDQFQLWLEIFWTRGERQLGSRPGGDLLSQLLSLKKLYSAGQAIVTFSWGHSLHSPREKGQSALGPGIFFPQLLKSARRWT